MGKPHIPIERDIAEFIARYRARGGDEGELLTAIAKAFPGCTYAAAGRAIALAGRRVGGGK